MRKYWFVWKTSVLLSVQASLENRLGAALFISAKLIRFSLFIVFINIVTQETALLGGYTGQQLKIFYLVFTFFDVLGQLLFRGIYWFREQIVSGEFDFRLTKPLNALFLALIRQTDILDLPLLAITTAMLWPILISLTTGGMVLALAAVLMSLSLITAIHILVASLGVLTTEVDHTIMIFRDVSAMARFPIDIYSQLIRVLLSFVIPIALAYTMPAKALMGLVTLQTLFLALSASLLFLLGSVLVWNQAVKHYSSASS